MPKKLEAKINAAYPNNPHAVYGTLNAIGAMRGNKETPKGRAMDVKMGRKGHPGGNLGTFLHKAKGR